MGAQQEVNKKYVKLYLGNSKLLGFTEFTNDLATGIGGDASVKVYDANGHQEGVTKGSYFVTVTSMGDVPVVLKDGVWTQTYSLAEGDETGMEIYFSKNFGDVTSENFSGTLVSANDQEEWPTDYGDGFYYYAVTWSNAIPWSAGNEFNGSFTIGGITVPIKCVVVE